MATQYSTPAYIISEILEDEGYIEAPNVGSPSWPYYLGRQPDRPPQAVTLYNADPRLDGRYMATGKNVTHPGVQIRVRSSVESQAYKKIEDIQLFLESILRRMIIVEEVTFVVQSVTLTSGILSLGSTEDKLFEFTLNTIITLSRV